MLGYIAPQNLGGTIGRRDEAEQHADGGRLARAVWSEQAKDRALSDLTRQVPDRYELVEPFGDVP